MGPPPPKNRIDRHSSILFKELRRVHRPDGLVPMSLAAIGSSVASAARAWRGRFADNGLSHNVSVSLRVWTSTETD
jgi:hypothetical protein